ncbi:hypothetical protein [Pyrococcus abyssi]|nr:hypothetical protein [Pyrococcus abyssi]
MWVDVAIYSTHNPPKLPKFRRARFEINGETLIFHLRPSGKIEVKVKEIDRVEGVLLHFFDPPRKALKIDIGDRVVLVSAGKNPLAYDSDILLKFIHSLYSALIDGVVVKEGNIKGSLRVIRTRDNTLEVIVVSDSGPVHLKNELNIENFKVRERIEELRSLVEFLKEDEQGQEQ